MKRELETSIVESKMKTPRLGKWLLILGVINFSLMLARTALSYFLVTVGPFGIPQPNEARFFNLLAQKFYFLGENFQNLLTGNSGFQQKAVFASALLLPVFLSTVVFIALLVQLKKYKEDINAQITQKLFRWSVIFALINFFAVPVLAQDFWLSIAWGKMTLAGINPYYNDLASTFTQDLPLDLNNSLRMTYGPLWALISEVVVFLSGGSNTLVAAILFKLLLAGAWIGSLYLVWKLLNRYSLPAQCIGLIIFGWLPLSITEIAAEGHNDIAMVFFMLLWLYKLESHKTTQATLALAAAALIKYTTAPLFLVEILYLFYSGKKPLKDYLISFLSAGLLITAVFAIFYRSPDFFASTSEMRNWQFFTPQEAAATVSRLLRIPLEVKYLPPIIFLITPFYCIFKYTKFQTTENFRRVVLAVMTAILFSLLGHVWTWFLLWVIPLSALLPGSALSRWNIGAAVVFPLAIQILQFTQFPSFILWNLTGLLIYSFAALWLLPVTRHWLSTKENSEPSPVLV
jgi:alpha-1,6-mannosyltransferase